MRKIGITGSSGVIGRHVENFVRRHNPRLEVIPYHGDILNEHAITKWAEKAQPDSVLHLAAVVPISSVEANPEGASRINIEGTQLLAETLLKSRMGKKLKFLYASTAHVYRSSPAPIREESDLAPLNLYAQTKLDAEVALGRVQKDHPELELTITRIFSVYSQDQPDSFLYPSLLRRFKESKSGDIELVGCNNVRDFLHAEQVAELLALLSMTNFSGVINVGSGKGKTIKQFAVEQTGASVKCAPTDFPPSHFVANVSRLTQVIGSDKLANILFRGS